MKRGLPHPLLSLSLLLVWLLLVNELSVGQLLLGSVLGWGIPLLTKAFWINPLQLRHPLKLLWFTLRFLADVVKANIEVAKRILGSPSKLQPGFVVVPLELRDERTLVMLASIISLTPGTVSADLSADRRALLLHCLDVADSEALVAGIKARYEAPLREIFPCSNS